MINSLEKIIAKIKISERWVISAAHCVLSREANDFAIVAGTNLRSRGGQKYLTDLLIVHEKYCLLN